jgi:hypothetical protein
MSEHINLKLAEEYMKQIKDIGQGLGIKDISKVYGAIPQILKFSITFTHSELDKISKGIPTLKPRLLDLLLSSIKAKKLLEYQEQRQVSKDKTAKKVIPQCMQAPVADTQPVILNEPLEKHV